MCIMNAPTVLAIENLNNSTNIYIFLIRILASLEQRML